MPDDDSNPNADSQSSWRNAGLRATQQGQQSSERPANPDYLRRWHDTVKQSFERQGQQKLQRQVVDSINRGQNRQPTTSQGLTAQGLETTQKDLHENTNMEMFKTVTSLNVSDENAKTTEETKF